MGLLTAVVVGLSAGGCSPDGPRTIVIGDSLTVGAQEQGLGTGPSASWRIDARSGRSTNEGIDIAKGLSIGSGDTVIVALGTNDYFDDEATFAARIDRMMQVVGKAKRIVWVNVDANGAKLARADEGVNAALAAARSRHPKLRIADWDAYIRTVDDYEELYEVDHVHYTAEGDAVRARWTEGLGRS